MIVTQDLGAARLLRIEHGKAGALDLELSRALLAALETAARDGRPLILTGTGSIFSAGVDLKRVLAGGPPYVREFLPVLSDALLALYRYEGPVIAAVNGHAIAGGAVLAFACDRRIMARGGGRFGVPELIVGVPFPPVPLEIVRAALPPPLAQEMILTGAIYDAETALARGAVDELVAPEQLIARAAEWGERLARIPAAAFRLTKAQLRAPALERINALREAGDRVVEEAWTSTAVLSTVQRYVEATLLGR
jgi:enoyl-CoA hydratase